jgi:hypothetical protein
MKKGKEGKKSGPSFMNNSGTFYIKIAASFVYVSNRVARFFLVHDTKTGKMYQINTNVPNGPKISQHFQISKFSQIGIFGLKRNHLATLVSNRGSFAEFRMQTVFAQEPIFARKFSRKSLLSKMWRETVN